MSYSTTTYKRSQDRKVQSINKLSPTFFEIIGETGNKYWYDSWTDTCNCAAGRRGSYCYHQRCVQELLTQEAEVAKQEQQIKEEIAREQVQQAELESNFVETSNHKTTGLEVIADLRDAGFGVRYLGIIGRAYTLEVLSCGDKVATIKFPISKKQLGLVFVCTENKNKAVLDVYHNTNPLMSHLQSIVDVLVNDTRELLFGI